MLKITQSSKYEFMFSLDSIRRMVQKVVKISFEAEDEIDGAWYQVIRDAIVNGISEKDIEKHKEDYKKILT